MEILANVYAVVIVLNWLATPFLFGTPRKPYTAGVWLGNLVINAPIVYLLWTLG